MYFAYRDSLMTGRLNELEARLDKLSSDNQPSGEHGLILFTHFLILAYLTRRFRINQYM